MVVTEASLRHAVREPLLEQSPRDAPDRHRTLRDAIAWSYRRLSQEEQRVFRHLGVLAGGGTVSSLRNVLLYFREATDRTATLGPALSTPTMTTAATAASSTQVASTSQPATVHR